jgi:AhpD family alkylhydroperoxidase
MKFKKRTYKNPCAFFKDLWFLTKNSGKIRKTMKSGIISPEFRERLMLAVTAVNGCKYCSYYHSKQALKTGLTQEEIDLLLAGSIANCPEDEEIALIYAQYWAEANARPDADAVSKLIEVYGDEKAEAIDIVLHMIRLGNLSGNTWDYFLYRISFGKLGV